MKDKLTGVLVGVAACIGLVAVSGFSSSSEQNQDHHHGRYQLVEAASRYWPDGNPRNVHVYLLDTETGHVWEQDHVRDYRDSAVAGRIDKEDYPSDELFVKIYVD